MVRHQHFQLFHLLRGLLVCIILTGFVPSVQASEVWIWRDEETSSSFVQKIDDTYTLLYFPTRAGILLKQSSSGYKASDGFINLGLTQHEMSEVTYNLPMAEFFYYLLNKSYLQKPYTDLDLSLLTYRRDDLLLDLAFTRGPWEFVLGGKFIVGRDYYLLAIEDGTAVNSPKNLYDFSSQYDLYKGYGDDLGYGGSGYFEITYQTTANWHFSLSADDLAGTLVWRGLDHYDGQIDLDFIKKDDNGFTYVQAPMSGRLSANQVVPMKLTPAWRGEIEYRTELWGWKNWLQYRKMLEFGTRGTLTYHSWPGLSLGIEQRNHQWLGSIGVAWPHFQVELAVNATNRAQLTSYFLKVQTHLF